MMQWLKQKISLRRSRRFLHRCRALYWQKHAQLSERERAELVPDLSRLEQAVAQGDAASAKEAVTALQEGADVLLRRRWLDWVWEIGGAVAFALLVAIVLRQCWFEPMQIPSGSMRPTYRELDRLVITKTAFGLNLPMKPRNFLFDSKLLHRGDAFIFIASGMDIPDQDGFEFGLPRKKRLIKRCMGLPGDRLYFYGGQLYGVDREGRDISVELQRVAPTGVDQVPCLSFEGRVEAESDRALTLKQMNQPVGRLVASHRGEIRGEVFDGQKWVRDYGITGKERPSTYGDFFGMNNYAMVRLLSREEVVRCSEGSLSDLPTVDYYLEFRHSPRLAGLRRHHDASLVCTSASLLPLTPDHLERLQGLMYTARILVEQGRAYRYVAGEKLNPQQAVPVAGIEDGIFEIFNGQAYRVSLGGVVTPLPETHPFNQPTPTRLQWLFNLGVELHPLVEPRPVNQVAYPSRFAYFRNGDLMVMGGMLMAREHPDLQAFVTREESQNDHAPFVDHGPPVTETGVVDQTFIKRFGVQIPEGMYLALGDNHSGSADSRFFGFVPQQNIRGAPALLLWPAGERWGLKSTQLKLLTWPRALVWSALIGCVTIGWLRRRRWSKPIGPVGESQIPSA